MSESRRTGPNTPPGERLVAAPRRTRSECRATSFSWASFVTTSCAPTMRSGTHDVLARIHAAAQLVPPPLGLERVGDEGGPEEMPREPDIELVPDARAPVGMDGAGPREILRE